MTRAADCIGAVQRIRTFTVAVIVCEGACPASLTVGVTLGHERVFDAFASTSVMTDGWESAGTFAASRAGSRAEISHIGQGFCGGRKGHEGIRIQLGFWEKYKRFLQISGQKVIETVKAES